MKNEYIGKTFVYYIRGKSPLYYIYFGIGEQIIFNLEDKGTISYPSYRTGWIRLLNEFYGGDTPDIGCFREIQIETLLTNECCEARKFSKRMIALKKEVDNANGSDRNFLNSLE